MDKEPMPAHEYTEVRSHYKTATWYRSLRYSVPVKGGTVFKVKTKDLHPGAMQRVDFICEVCGKRYSNRWRDYLKKESNTCQECQNHPDNCHSYEYWLKKLLRDNPDAVCNITGETDKRFLVLHHLLGRRGGGKNSEYNFVVLTANMHLALHREIGTRETATPEAYYAFKQKETK